MDTKNWKKFSGMQCLKLRSAANLTQKDLAEHIFSTQSYIAKIEMGIKKPSADLLFRMAQEFGCPMEELFE